MRPLLQRLLPLLLMACTLCLPVATATADDAASRDRALLGQVLDTSSGDGVQGQTVTLRWVPPESDASYPAPWVAEHPGGGRPVVGVGVTDQDGRFGFVELVAGHYELHLGGGLRDVPVLVQLPADGTSVIVDIEVELGRHIDGQVATASGEPAPRADVFISHIEGQSGSNRPMFRHAADREGRFLIPGLPGGAVWISAYHPDHGFSPPRRVAPGESDDGISVDLQLRDEAHRLWPLDRQPFAGIGVSLHLSAVGPRIETIQPAGPAARAGVRVGDILVRIDGIEARPMSLVEVLMRCRGAAGTELDLVLEREGDLMEVTLTRAALE